MLPGDDSFADINDFASNAAIPPQLRVLISQEVARQAAPFSKRSDS